MKLNIKHLLLLTGLLYWSLPVNAFCGFYVAKADAKLFNESSQVIMARDGNHTVITMSNDFSGAVKDFAMVVPVPEVLQESDIRVVQQHIFDKFDAYTAPRMVEYWDHNPCQVVLTDGFARPNTTTRSMDFSMVDTVEEEKDLGVTVEATYTVGEYDILILSAKESSGLKTWLLGNGYKIPKDAEEVLDPYIRDQMKFFVVKVNLEAQKQSGYSSLRPLQIQFNSDRFMLPIRLGMANAKSTQDLIVYTFTRNGRVETANYRTTKLPTDRDIPEFIMQKGLFGDFYKAVYDKAWKQEGRNSVMLEYAWNVSGTNPVKCDPCNTPAVTFAELREAGVWWIQPGMAGGYTGQLFVTRLHVRYGREKFPQDLVFLNTPNSENFQGRYVIRHPATGTMDCAEGKKYQRNLAMRKKREMDELASLTGWNLNQYQWYIGQTETTPPRKIEPQIEPDRLLAPTKEVIGAVEDTVEQAETVAVVLEEGDTTERDAFIEKAQAEAQKASTPLNSNWMLVLVAGVMFAAGLWFRRRQRT